MNKVIIVINGSGQVGKDTFVSLFSQYIPTINYSSVDGIKKIAKKIGWTGYKTEKDRKFLSDLKLLTADYNDFPFQCLETTIEHFYLDNQSYVLFLHIREPEEIKKIVDKYKAKTILIKNNRVKQITSNMADANVFNYNYDFIIENNGTIEELETQAQIFSNHIKDKYL